MMAEPRSHRVARAALAFLILAAASCAHMPWRKKTNTEVKLGDSGLTISLLQTEVLRFADNYVNSVAFASDALAAGVGSPRVQVMALKWKLGQANAAYADATGENPVWNALDLAVLSMVSRMVVTHPDVRQEFGPPADALVAVHVQLEKSAWALVATFLTPDQSEELRSLVEEWRRANPNERSITGARFREFALNLGKFSSTDSRQKPTSIFSMLYLDPFAGLDPTTVAIDQSRELAERVTAYAERLPTLVRWQAELLALQVGEQPTAKDLTADFGRTARAIESISKTAEGLPELVDTQRQEAIDQVFAGVTAQREALLAELDSRDAKIRSLLAELRETMNAGGQMGESLTGTIKSLDAFVHYVSPPPNPNAPPSTGKPFDPLDYGKAASQVGGMARDLNTLLASAGSSAPALAKISSGAGDDLKRVVDHAFWMGVLLILVLLVGWVLARLAYRSLELRVARSSRAGDGAP
jgi:hypothetical protein